MFDLFKNCHKATFLSIKDMENSASLLEKCQYKIHLLFCAACRNFVKQSLLINRLFKELPSHFNKKLSDNKKAEIQNEIKKRLQG